MDFDYLDFIAWIDRCMFPVDLSNDLQELGLNKNTALYFELEWIRQNSEPHQFKIMRIWQAYCLGDKANDSDDGKNMGFYLKIWLENMHKTWESYKTEDEQ